MGISDKIEAFIIELLKEDNEAAEFGRNELAQIFGCVPSQINYVISTRFSPERGFAVESRRGGGGYIKIRRSASGNGEMLMQTVGNECDFKTAESVINYLYEQDILEKQSAKMLLSAVSERALSGAGAMRHRIRADILKNVLVNM